MYLPAWCVQFSRLVITLGVVNPEVPSDAPAGAVPIAGVAVALLSSLLHM
jgi:hypothetical protein